MYLNIILFQYKNICILIVFNIIINYRISLKHNSGYHIPYQKFFEIIKDKYLILRKHMIHLNNGVTKTQFVNWPMCLEIYHILFGWVDGSPSSLSLSFYTRNFEASPTFKVRGVWIGAYFWLGYPLKIEYC